MKKNRIVVIHLGGIGDTIHDLAMLKQLVSFCPGSQIFYVCQKGNEVIVDLAGLGKSITAVPVKSRLHLLSLYLKLPLRPEVIVVGCGMNIGMMEYFVSSFFPKRAGASLPDYPRERLKKFQPKGKTFDILVGPIYGAHRIFVNWEVLRLLGIPGDLCSPLMEKQRVKTIALPTKTGWNPEKPFAVLHHGAASLDHLKRWKESSWARVADKIIEQYDLDILLVGGKQEIKSSGSIVDFCAHKDRIFDATGMFSLPQLVRVISEAVLVVGTDSGPGHIAAAVGTPLVAVFGPTCPSQVAPISENGYIVYHPAVCGPCYWGYEYDHCSHDHICMKAINEESLIKAAGMAMGNSSQDSILLENGDIIIKCPTVSRCRDWPPAKEK
jgi:ADP-heptose:LPS heptosyltransferase